MIRTIIEGIKQTFISRRCRVVLPFLTVLFFTIYFYTPILSSELTISSQIQYLKIKGLTVLFIFSLLSALSFTMFLFSSFFMKSPAVKEAGGAGLGIISGFLSALLATASCSYCLIAFLGFLGSSGVFFVYENKDKIMTLSIILLIISIYFLSKKVVEGCKTCKVDL